MDATTMHKLDVPDLNIPRIIIVGGGFGGIELAKKLRKADVQVVMLDKNNYHTFQPLLYQVATAGLEPDSIAFPLRKIFKQQGNFYFRMAKAERILPQSNTLVTNIGNIHYDYLVLATGSATNYFGMQDFTTHSLPMKSIPEALNLRSVILQNFEKALLTDNLNERESLMNFVIVGGGPTGVEMAGAMGELKKHVLPNDYPELDFRRMRIHLVEAGNRLLGAMSDQSSQKALDFLKAFDIHVWLGTSVTTYDGQLLQMKNGKTLQTQTVIWSAGVKGEPLEGISTDAIGRGQRILTDEFNRIKGHDNIFAIGDLAAIITEQTPNGHPMLAPVAMQQGNLLAQNIVNLIQNKPTLPFKYFDKGSMATVGRNKAVVEVGRLKSQGFIAWFLWMAVHLMTLVGFRNKLVTLVNWMWSYFNYDRGIRLIIRPYRYALPYAQTNAKTTGDIDNNPIKPQNNLTLTNKNQIN